jgi:serine/threonine-protein kinase RsbW
MMHDIVCGQINGLLIDRRNQVDNGFVVGGVHQLLIQDLRSKVARSDRSTHNAGVPLPAKVKDDSLRLGTKLLAPTEPDGNNCTPLAEGTLANDELRPAIVSREFEFPGDVASVTESREQVMQFVAQHCPDECDQIDILVALQEALVNAALHGCGDDPTKRIQCGVAVDASDITITVRDPGPGFDLALADPEKYAASTMSHGRGICLIRGLMTEVNFARGGSELRMRKHFSRCSP